MKGKILYRCVGNVDKHIREEVKKVVKGFQKVSDVKHNIYILVYDQPVLEDSRGIFWGQFMVGNNNKDVAVVVAGKPRSNDARRDYIENGQKRYYKAKCVGQTILHELAHYERYRDNRTQTENGINRRATSLYKQIEKLNAS